jgi:hypothetical protein
MSELRLYQDPTSTDRPTINNSGINKKANITRT